MPNNSFSDPQSLSAWGMATMTEMPRVMWTMATMTALPRVMILPAGRMCVMLTRMFEVFVLFYIKYVTTSTVTTASRWWTWRRRPLIWPFFEPPQPPPALSIYEVSHRTPIHLHRLV
jgi:hypothetical protein